MIALVALAAITGMSLLAFGISDAEFQRYSDAFRLWSVSLGALVMVAAIIGTVNVSPSI